MQNAMSHHSSASALLSLALLGAAACGGSSSSIDDTAQPHAVTPAPTQLSFDVFTGDESGFYASSTLIMSEKDAILVDAQFNLSNGDALARWIETKGRSLKAIYITHAHPDHYFGAEEVLESFPNTPIYATAEVIEHMNAIEAEKLAYWGPIYKGDLTTNPAKVTALAESYLELEGTRLDLVTIRQGDTDPTTIVHAPSLDLVVAGDVTFQGVHAWLAETPTEPLRAGWLGGLGEVAALNPVHVIAGHRAPSADTSPASIEETRRYIEDFSRLRSEHATAEPFVVAMTKLYPENKLPIILQIAAESTYAK